MGPELIRISLGGSDKRPEVIRIEDDPIANDAVNRKGVAATAVSTRLMQSRGGVHKLLGLGHLTSV